MKTHNRIQLFIICLVACFLSFGYAYVHSVQRTSQGESLKNQSSVYLIVLGTAQDGGYPQAGCNKECCRKYYEGKEPKHYVSCLALVDAETHQRWFFDCTPDFPAQLRLLDSIFPPVANPNNPGDYNISGIFLTHAHIGHYTGLMFLGRETMGTKDIPVYAMPRMRKFLRENGPWNQLVSIHNIDIQNLAADSTIHLNERISVTPFLVAHRAEYSETVGYRISTPHSNVIFIPDIDRWSNFGLGGRNIEEVVKQNDYLFLDGTFFKEGELPGVRMEEVPHPCIEESMQMFSNLSEMDKQKIYFIHLNHTNPALTHDTTAVNEIKRKGFNIAREKDVFVL